jgi:hypothetical protein
MKTKHQNIIRRLVKVLNQRQEKITTHELIKFVNRNFPEYRNLSSHKVEELIAVAIYS